MEKIFKILFKYQEEMIKLSKDAENPFFKSSYTTLDNILNHYLPKLNKDGILCFHTVQDKELATSLVLIESGEQITSKFPLNNTDPQKQGSEISYGKRYNLSCLLNIQTDGDDDGNIASSGGNTKQHYNNNERGLIDCINDMKSAKTAEDKIKFKDEGKTFAKSEKQIKWLTDEWNKLG